MAWDMGFMWLGGDWCGRVGFGVMRWGMMWRRGVGCGVDRLR